METENRVYNSAVHVPRERKFVEGYYRVLSEIPGTEILNPVICLKQNTETF